LRVCLRDFVLYDYPYLLLLIDGNVELNQAYQKETYFFSFHRKF